MQPEHSSMTVVASVKPDQEAALKKHLREIGRDIKNNAYIHFADFPTIHFARWVVIPPPDPDDPDEPPRGANEPPSPYFLAFGTDHDGSDQLLLDDLVRLAGAALDAIYSFCDNWPGIAEPARAVAYLRERRIPYGARHIACRRRTVSQLKAVVAARERMNGYIDGTLKPGRAVSSEVAALAAAANQFDAICHNAAPPALAPPPPNWQLPALAAATVGIIGMGLCLLFRRSPIAGFIGVGAVVGIPAAFLAALRGREEVEKRKFVEATPPTLNKMRELRSWEDHIVQNQMTHVVTIRRGTFRGRTLRGVLRAVDFLARTFWNRGELGGIPSIHFARWMIIDNGRRLLFFSNYDGSWENYLGDFIDRASAGLTGVWSNTVGYPPTRFLIGDGSRRAEAFKNWTRQHQVETQVWYSAYPAYSVLNLLDALALCEKPTNAPADALLRRL